MASPFLAGSTRVDRVDTVPLQVISKPAAKHRPAAE
jgi:hypothetical protein